MIDPAVSASAMVLLRPMRRIGFRRSVAACVALAGLFLIGDGLWIHAKALLAQVLLERAFATTMATGQVTKPWPWADTWPVARLTVPRIGAHAIVLAGSSGQALAFGPGHVEHTPDAGERGVAVYAAHRDTHFAFLKDVLPGDLIVVTRADGRTLHYRADHATVVRFDAAGSYAGFDAASPLARAGGKLDVLRALGVELRGPLALVGDGATDLEAAPAAARFVAFGGVVRRPAVFAGAAVRAEDPDLAALCRRNCRDNEVQGEIVVADVLNKGSRQAAGLALESADLVLTNPPFLEEGQARISPDRGRAAAHALPAGGLEAWLKACTGLLKPKGRLVLIHRADRVAECLEISGKWLGGIELRFVHPVADRPAIRFLLSGIKGSRAPLTILPPVILHGPDGRFTPEAEALHRGEATLL